MRDDVYPQRSDVCVAKYDLPLVWWHQGASAVAQCREVVEQHVASLGLGLVGWRPLPVDNSALGPTSLESEPHTEMLLDNICNFILKVLAKRADGHAWREAKRRGQRHEGSHEEDGRQSQVA